METSGVFRTLNFELYTRPNKWVMGFGLVAISVCLGYLAWLKSQPVIISMASPSSRPIFWAILVTLGGE